MERPRDKTFYNSKCSALDRQIDNLAYELYDLTLEEIAIVEGAGNSPRRSGYSVNAWRQRSETFT